MRNPAPWKQILHSHWSRDLLHFELNRCQSAAQKAQALRSLACKLPFLRAEATTIAFEVQGVAGENACHAYDRLL